MDRREFGKTALGAAAAALIIPAAQAATPRRSIKDCVVIDYDTRKKKWRHLKQRDEVGHTFVYDETSTIARYRHFEFFGSDGTVVGTSTPVGKWTHCYDQFETEFVRSYKTTPTKPMTHAQFLRYVEEVRDYLDGRIVPIDSLG